MVVLKIKALREIRKNIGVYLACIFVVIIGLLTYTSMSIVLENLLRAQEEFYTETHFADGFIKINRFPESEVNNLAKNSGSASRGYDPLLLWAKGSPKYSDQSA